MPLGDLLRAADAVIVGRVVDTHSTLHATGQIRTRVRIAVEHVLAGNVGADEIQLVVPGGASEGEVEIVPGAPEFYPDQTYVLTLRRSADHDWRPVHWGAGVFALSSERPARLRQSLGSAWIALPAETEASSRDWSWEEFTNELQSVRRDVRELTPPRQVTQPPRPRFQLARPTARLFEPDVALAVPFYLTPEGDRGLGPDSSLRAVRSGVEIWSSPALEASLRLDLGGPLLTPEISCPNPDGQNFKIRFNDPDGIIDPPIACRGILALTSYRATQFETKTFTGETFARIRCATLTFADGWENCPEWTECNVAEIVTHELGHAIGLAHSSEREPEPNDRLRLATLYLRAHFDGRCAGLMADDVDGLRFLYPTDVPPTIVDPEQLPTAVADERYAYTFGARGGTLPLTWDLVRSDFCGIDLSIDGTLSGSIPACRCPARALPPSPTPEPTPLLVVRVVDANRREHSRFFRVPLEAELTLGQLPLCTPTPIAPSPPPSHTPTLAGTATPTHFLSATTTPLVPSPSPTSSLALLTPTVTPSNSPSPRVACLGDCDGSGEVTVEEIVRLVHVSLGVSPVAICPAGDRDGDGNVTIEEIVAAVHVALTGC